MRNKWVALIACGLTLMVGSMLAAEKNRDWQSGLVVESKTLPDPRDHAIASADKTYLVKGSIENNDEALAIGASVRFAVEDKTMFVSIAGKEYKLSVLGVRAGATKPAPVTAAVPAPPPAPKPVPPPQTSPQSPPAPVSAAVPAPAPAASASDTLDNDAVVKMVLGGLKEDTVVSVIQARPGKYTLTADALLGLKAAGVPQSVIAAMTAKMKR
jgi:hypothetical protein